MLDCVMQTKRTDLQEQHGIWFRCKIQTNGNTMSNALTGMAQEVFSWNINM